MLMPMRAIFLLCGIFLIPDIFTASKSTGNFFRPDQDYEEVQDYSENFKENVAEPLIIEEFERKQSDPCQGQGQGSAKPSRRIIRLQTIISCNQGPYKELVKVPQSNNKFIWLTKCKGHVSHKTRCQAIKNETILVSVDGQCFKMNNETKCQEKCIKSPNECKSTQTFNKGRCECESQKLF